MIVRRLTDDAGFHSAAGQLAMRRRFWTATLSTKVTCAGLRDLASLMDVLFYFA